MKIERIVSEVSVPDLFFREFDRDRPVVLFGAGGGCLPAIHMFEKQGIRPVLIADNDQAKWGQKREDIPVVSLGEAEQIYSNYVLFVSAPANAHQIIPDLRNRCIKGEIVFFDYPDRINRTKYRKYLLDKKSQLMDLYDSFEDDLSRQTMEVMLRTWMSGDFRPFEDIFTEDQYFVPGIVRLTKDEAFLDIGAYTGDSIESFLKAANNQYKKIIAVEPNPACQSSLLELQDKLESVQVIPKGVYSKAGAYAFVADDIASMSNFEMTQVEGGIEVDTIDNMILEAVTLIKMDIEGLELEALKGARKTIERNRPKLAICVYHKYNDLLQLSQFILNLKLGYRLYLRHHSFYTGETVLYAV